MVVVQRNDYYPFGAPFAKSSNPNNQRFKFGGKELDMMHGLNLFDFHARQHDGARLQFTTVDPMAEEYYSWSLYAYCGNNPMKFIDPTGMAYTYVYPNEETGEEGGYYVNDNGERVEWDEVQKWLNATDQLITDQNEIWGELSILANPGSGEISSILRQIGSGSFGHSWIEIHGDNEYRETSYGTYGNMGKKTFYVNYERNKANYKATAYAYLSTPITKKQRLLIDMFNLNPENVKWEDWYNCTGYAMKLWTEITGKHIDYFNYIIPENPTGLYKAIISKQTRKLPFKY